MDAKEYANQLKTEANKLLEYTHLTDLLRQFGKVDLGGSYAYDLMVDRDLDYGVVVDMMTPEIRANIAETFAKQPWAYGVNLTDRINFEPLSNLQAPRGLYLGLTIPFPKDRWNVDVWFTLSSDKIDNSLPTQISKASDNQKRTILEIKYALMQEGKKEKGVTAAAVYKAVLEDNVKSVEDFLGQVK